MKYYYLFVLLSFILIIVVIILIWVNSSACQQLIILELPINEMNRYAINKIRKIEKIELVVTTSPKKPVLKLKELMTNFLKQYENSVIIKNSDIFAIKTDLERKVIEKDPTLENINVILFNKLKKLTSKINCHLVSIKLSGEGLSASYTRNKFSNYLI